MVGIPNYTFFRRDRLRGKGDGVCAYVRSSISCSVFVLGSDVESRPSDVEILWLVCSLGDCHYCVACCYHPPKPMYNTNVFSDVLSIDYINSLYPEAVIIIAGDFDQLNTSFLDVDHNHALVQMVSIPTHCGHSIDKVFVSRPDLYTCVVVRSVLKTKRCAVILACSQDACHLPSSRTKRKVKLCDLRSPNIDRLRYYSLSLASVKSRLTITLEITFIMWWWCMVRYKNTIVNNL